MSHVTGDARWPQVLSLAVHEFRTPMTVVAGYIRMLLKDAAGPLTEAQRHMLNEADRSCARLSGLLAEMSDLASLESSAAAGIRATVDLRALLSDAIDRLPPAPLPASVRFEPADGPATVEGDPARLRLAFTSVFVALRRELLPETDLLVRESVRHADGRSTSWLAIAPAQHIDALSAAGPTDLATFDEWRGGCGLSLGVARRVLERHGARIWSAMPPIKPGAIIAFTVQEHAKTS